MTTTAPLLAPEARAELRELLAKYDLLLALRAGVPGRTIERRDAMRTIAAQFPAALREWDAQPPAEIERRRAVVAEVLDEIEAGAPADRLATRAAAEPWLRFGLDLHRYLRTLLRLRKLLGSATRTRLRARLDAGLGQDRAPGSRPKEPPASRSLLEQLRRRKGAALEEKGWYWPEPITDELLVRVTAPPHGRLAELAYAAVAARHGVAVSEVKSALFSSAAKPVLRHPNHHTMHLCESPALPAAVKDPSPGPSPQGSASPQHRSPPQPPASAQLHAELALRRAVAVDSILDCVGNTPLVRLANLEPPGVEVWAKCEFCNPGGSVKDRPALKMIRDAIASGRLTRDKTIIDATSGNTGVAYSLVGAALGYRVKLVMPANVSAARKQITSAYGTELVFSSEMEGSDGAIRMVRELVAAEPDRYFYPDQYSNESNPGAHYHGTGPEILALLGERITHFVAGVGTSGTVMGTGRRMKEHRRPDGGGVTVVAVEPDDAFHGLEGLKHMESSLVPQIWRPQECVDRILRMSTDDGWATTDQLKEAEGLFVGHSAGANVAAALRVARELAARGETGCVVTVLCDRGDRYFVPLKWERRYEY